MQLHRVRRNMMNPNVISQKLSEFFECLDINTNSIVLIFVSKPQTKALQRTHPINGILKFISIYFKEQTNNSAKIAYFFFLSTILLLNAIFRAAFQSALIPS